MNCREVQALLDDLMDGDLPEAQRRKVQDHLRGCAECRTSEARLRALLARVGALPRSLAPARDPWPGIVSRITAGEVIEHDFAGRGRRWYLLAAAAAAAAVLILTVSLVTEVLVSRERASRVALAPERSGTAVGVTPASLELAKAQATYAAARQQLLAALEARKGSLSPQTLAVVKENLRIIDRAVGEMQAALARDPGNRELPMLLVTAYRQEIDLLRRVTQLPSRG
jgi:predicted anti-sigma-YlaC factor YlaD